MDEKQQEHNLERLVKSITDFDNPHSIMMTSSLLMGAALQMYSMVLAKEDMQELLKLAHKNLDGRDDTVYH